MMRRLLLLLVVGSFPCMAQHPLIFDVSTVVAGAQHIETLYALASGKWSDGGDKVGINSTAIHCYQRFGFCEVATALIFGTASVSLDSFDILRWDTRELIAIDSSAVCVVNTLRFDFIAKKVSISSASKGEEGRNKLCAELTSSLKTTAFLTGALNDNEPKKK